MTTCVISLNIKNQCRRSENIALVCEEKGIYKIVFQVLLRFMDLQSQTDESGAIKPFNEYGRTKFEAEERFRAWCAWGRIANHRAPLLFSASNRGNVFNLLNQIASGKFIMVGAGENKKSMAYIGNVVAFLSVSQQTKNMVFTTMLIRLT